MCVSNGAQILSRASSLMHSFSCYSFLSVRAILSDVGGNVLVSRSIPNSLINLALGSTSSLKLVCLGLSGDQLTVRSDGM